MTQRYVYIPIVLCAVALALAPTTLVAQDRQPYSVDQLIRLIESGVFPDSRILMLAKESCIAFKMDEESEARLEEAGASRSLLGGLSRVCIRLPREVTWIRVSPDSADVLVGANRALRAEALAPDSTTLPGVIFEWSAADTSIAEVSMGGMVLGKRSGATEITARSEDGTVGTATVLVLAPGVASGRPAAGRDGEGEAEAERVATKSAATAGVLGALVPGGGEFYAGNTARGAVVLLGSAGALAAGYFLTTDEFVGVGSPIDDPTCDGGVCTRIVPKQFKEKRQVVIGAAVAGAFWLFGLVDGVRSAKNWEPPEPPLDLAAEESEGAELSVELAPADGVRYTPAGDLELTFIRIRS